MRSRIVVALQMRELAMLTPEYPNEMVSKELQQTVSLKLRIHWWKLCTQSEIPDQPSIFSAYFPRYRSWQRIHLRDDADYRLKSHNIEEIPPRRPGELTIPDRC